MDGMSWMIGSDSDRGKEKKKTTMMPRARELKRRECRCKCKQKWDDQTYVSRSLGWTRWGCLYRLICPFLFWQKKKKSLLMIQAGYVVGSSSKMST